jgi:hypothetical protein
MRTIYFLAIVIVIMLCSWTTPAKSGFLFFNANQLKPLGIELNENGVFYRNLNPKWRTDNMRYSGLNFYCCNSNYLTTQHYLETDELKAQNKVERILMQVEVTKNDFYPLLIGNTKGDQSLDNVTLPNEMKLLPVAICMSETKLSNRKDTIIVWFKPTETLRKALPPDINMDDFLRVPVRK